MFVSKWQVYYFAECLFIGVVSALASETLTVFLIAFKNKIFRHAAEFASFVVVAVVYFYASLYFKFPSVRAYMIVGVLLGFRLERATVGKTLAKYLETCYNKAVKSLRRKAYDRKKNAKTRFVRHGGGGSDVVRSSRRARLSTRGVKFTEKGNGKVAKRIRTAFRRYGR